MKLKHHLNESDDIEVKIINFFADNPNPKDNEIHKFSDDEGINTHKFEEIIYGIMGSFFGAGKSKGFTGEYDPKELSMGIKIEMEHTTNPLISERIAKDHLSEFDKYYTALVKMEKNLINI